MILLLRRKLVSADILDEALANGDKGPVVVGSVLENKIPMAEMVLEISLNLVFVIFLGQYIILFKNKS